MRHAGSRLGAGVWRALLQQLPFGLSAARLVAALCLPGLAGRNRRGWCVAIIAGSVIVDLADGILARRLCAPTALRRQRRLDGHADAVFTIMAPLAANRLRSGVPAPLRTPLVALLLAQACAALTSLARFGRLPRFGTGAYRWSAGAVGLGLAGYLAGGRYGMVLRPALWLLALAHVEALAIALRLDRYRAPVRSLRDCRRSIAIAAGS